MNATTDLDRLLGEWLDEGPRRAPDRPLELAVQHARTHSRRPDPIRFLRPDVMAPRRSSFGLRPVLVLAALALALVAVVVVGGGSPDPVVAPPVASPSATPDPTSGVVEPIVVELEVTAGQPQRVTVIDEARVLAGARSGVPDPNGGQSFPFDAVDVSSIDATTLQLAWAGYPCATDHTLHIDAEGSAIVLTRPTCEGETDTIALDRILVLEFSRPIDPVDVTVSLEE